MSQLFFKKALQIAIREGRKRTTIRRWDRPRLHAGQRAFSPGLGWLAIESVEPIRLEQLSDDDARLDGFDSLSGLMETLLAIYPDHADDAKSWFRVSFSLHAPQPARARKRCPADGKPTPF